MYGPLDWLVCLAILSSPNVLLFFLRGQVSQKLLKSNWVLVLCLTSKYRMRGEYASAYTLPSWILKIFLDLYQPANSYDSGLTGTTVTDNYTAPLPR